MASERSGKPKDDAERSFFATFAASFPGAASLLVDTYDTDRGIKNAVLATEGKLTGIRIDSNVSREALAHARKLLADLGAPHAKIFVSDGLDEHKVKDLSDLVDGFGVGENITCSPDAATGIGAVAKLVMNGYGAITMKLAKGSGKATLPGRLQVYRFADHDLVTLASEPAQGGGKPLLSPFWRGGACVREPLPIADTRAYVRSQIAALPEELSRIESPVTAEGERKLVISDKLRASVERLAREANQ